MEDNFDDFDKNIVGFDEDERGIDDFSNDEEDEEEDIIDLGEDDEVTEEEQHQTTESSLADVLYEEFEWEGVPKDIDPITAIKMIKEGYENVIKEMQNNTQPQETPQELFIEDRKEIDSAYKEWLSLSPKDALIEDLIDSGYDEEDARAEADDLENEGKLERKYRALKTSIKNEYEESLNTVKEQEKVYLQKQQQEKAILEQQQQMYIDNSISNLESPLFEVTKKDKEFVRNLYKRGEIEKFKNDPKLMAEMVLAYVKVKDIKEGQVKMKKEIATKIVNNLSKDPIVNTKISKEQKTNVFQRK